MLTILSSANSCNASIDSDFPAPGITEENNILFFTISKFNLQHGPVNWQATIVNLMKVMERQAHLLHVTKVK